MEPESTQPSLLHRVRDTSNRAAWREFDRKYGDLIIGYCRSCGLQLSDAEDVRQLVMLNLSKALPAFEYQPGLGRFRDYLRRVVRNSISRQLTRHTGSETALDNDVLEALSDPGAEESDSRWEEQWVRQHCRTALQTLRQSYDTRSIEVFDHLLSGATITEVASAFQMTPVAVRKAKQRVKDRLQVILARQIRDEDAHA
ncbi:MAG: sigma-70 family RNA polymerase sigma factor [Phycisphaerales bacterium]|nr:sigma-70 family RNA polymerase sigma factor [Phycisphaerales bacterium]